MSLPMQASPSPAIIGPFNIPTEYLTTAMLGAEERRQTDLYSAYRPSLDNAPFFLPLLMYLGKMTLNMTNIAQNSSPEDLLS